MKKYINLNNFFTKQLVKILSASGVKNVVLSPGSRNTPLVIAFDKNKTIKKHVVVDERSNAFFALGIAKQSNRPVAIVTTSGTAVVELYPAIVEAYYSRVPLIICTADRPERLVNKGANQTINQYDIFNNHIRYFWDSCEIKPTLSYFNTAFNECSKAIITATSLNIGPVHLNIRFEKPLEKFANSHNIDKTFLEQVKDYKLPGKHYSSQTPKTKVSVIRQVEKAGKILCLTGCNVQKQDELNAITRFADHTGALIIGDGLSHCRYDNKYHKKRQLINATAFIRNRNFVESFDPDLIIQFGNAPTSNILLNYFQLSNAKKVLVNEFGDITDPSCTYTTIVKSTITTFFEQIYKNAKGKSIQNRWQENLIELDKEAQKLKQKFISNSSFANEARIINELFSALPKNSNLMVSNSIPPRDVDYFADTFHKSINIFHNRGASGIDGIISTAAGIASGSNNRTYLLIGDIAFAHDISALSLLNKYSIPVTIVLINNSGGAIFEMLPVYKEKIDFDRYFKTPTGIDFKKVVKAFGGSYSKVRNWKHMRDSLANAPDKFSVLEIVTDSQKSLVTRKKYWHAVTQKTQEIIDANRTG